jgi:hypothetical protein
MTSVVFPGRERNIAQQMKFDKHEKAIDRVAYNKIKSIRKAPPAPMYIFHKKSECHGDY